ncbi:hypothetical protein ACRRVA_03295 [Candidatus Cardinium hertigii]|uniref:hypothetical protein n=1 Tax=Candidatus Cardinium hertigii TaxID=247481 RepID=UPI003D7C3BF4
MKPITYSKKIVLILAWYGIMVLNGTACFKSVEKKYWSVDNTRDFIREKANGISEKEVPANNFLADAIEEDNAIYLCSDHKMVDESSEEENGIYQRGNSTYHKLQPSNLPDDSIIILDDVIKTDPTDQEEQAEQIEDSINQEHEKQTLQDEQTQQD